MRITAAMKCGASKVREGTKEGALTAPPPHQEGRLTFKIKWGREQPPIAFVSPRPYPSSISPILLPNFITSSIIIPPIYDL